MHGSDDDFLATALQLASENADRGRPPFGALVARAGEELATGVNTTPVESDPTAHAEMEAIRSACRSLGVHELDGATIYSSCEPCPMCLGAAALVGVSRIVYAATRESAARGGFVLGPAGVELQDAWHGSAALPVEHVSVAGADEPFTRFLGRH